MYTGCLVTLYGTIKIVFLGNSFCWSKMISNNYQCLTFYRNKSEFLFECLVKYSFYFTIPSLLIFYFNYQFSLSHNHISCVSEWAEHPVVLHSECFYKHNQSNLKFLGKATICILVTTDFIYMRWCNDIDQGGALRRTTRENLPMSACQRMQSGYTEAEAIAGSFPRHD